MLLYSINRTGDSWYSCEMLTLWNLDQRLIIPHNITYLIREDKLWKTNVYLKYLARTIQFFNFITNCWRTESATDAYYVSFFKFRCPQTKKWCGSDIYSICTHGYNPAIAFLWIFRVSGLSNPYVATESLLFLCFWLKIP